MKKKNGKSNDTVVNDGWKVIMQLSSIKEIWDKSKIEDILGVGYGLKP